MKTWQNLLNLILLAIIVLLFLGVLDTRTAVAPSEQILGFMKENKARVALIIGEDGRVSSINEKGDPARECSVGPDGKYPQCKGLGPKGTVLSSNLQTILRVRGSNCITIIDGDGKATDYCW